MGEEIELNETLEKELLDLKLIKEKTETQTTRAR